MFSSHTFSTEYSLFSAELGYLTMCTLGAFPRFLRGLHGFLRYLSRFDGALRGILVVFSHD